MHQSSSFSLPSPGSVLFKGLLKVNIWRRGRGVILWDFVYVSSRKYAKAWSGTDSWYTSPGYYSKQIHFVYRLTIDHDHPHKVIWLGKKVGRKWVNVEALYEPLFVLASDFYIFNSGFGGRRPIVKHRKKGYWRKLNTLKFLKKASYETVRFQEK